MAVSSILYINVYRNMCHCGNFFFSTMWLSAVCVILYYFSVIFFLKKCIKDLVVRWKGCNFALAFRRKGLRIRLLDGCSAVETKNLLKTALKFGHVEKRY